MKVKQLFERLRNEEGTEIGQEDFTPVTTLQSIYDDTTKVPLDQILALVNHWYLPYNGNAIEVYNKIPSIMRHAGLIITYRDEKDSPVTRQYIGVSYKDSEWSKISNWVTYPQCPCGGGNGGDGNEGGDDTPTPPTPPIPSTSTVQFNAYTDVDLNLVNNTNKIVTYQHTIVKWTLPATITVDTGNLTNTENVVLQRNPNFTNQNSSNHILYSTSYSVGDVLTGVPGNANISSVTARVIVKDSEDDGGHWESIDVNVTDVIENFETQSYESSTGGYTVMKNLGTLTIKGTATYE